MEREDIIKVFKACKDATPVFKKAFDVFANARKVNHESIRMSAELSDVLDRLTDDEDCSPLFQGAYNAILKLGRQLNDTEIELEAMAMRVGVINGCFEKAKEILKENLH